MKIEELREISDDGGLGSVEGYFAWGHFDPQEFAVACNKEFEPHIYHDSPVFLDKVQRVYAKKEYVEADNGSYFLDFSRTRKKDYLPITCVDI
jgi:hypothetical protein